MAGVPSSSSHINYSNYPLKDIPQPHAHDVLCGRGGGTNNHIGNSHWRMLVAANKQLYISLPKRQKMLLSRSIVNAVRSQMPPGRFLQKDEKTSLWFDVGDQRAQEKTSQALREGAPDIRKKGANVAGSASAAAKEGGSVLPAIGSYDGEEESNQGEGNSASDHTLNDNSTGPPMVPDTSATPTSLSAENATSSSNEVDSSAPTSSLKQPQVVSASSGRLSSSENSDGGGMPPLFFPNSSTTSTDSFDNPLLQHQNFFASSGSHNHAAMMQMMYQNMYMNYGSAMFHPTTATMSSLLTPQQQQQHRHMMQMMMASTGNVGEGMNPHNMTSPFSTSGPAVMQATSSMLGNVPNQQHLHNNDYHSRRRSEKYEDDDDSSFLEPLPLNHSALAAAAAGGGGGGTRGGGGSQPQGTFIPTFDEFVVQAPDTLEPAGLSYGSMSMSESEMRRLQSITASFGSNSRGSYTTNPNSNNNNNDPMPNHINNNNDDNNHYHQHPNNNNMLYPRQELMQQPTHNQHQYNNNINNNSNSMVHKNKLNHHHKSHSASNHESSAVPAALDSLEPTGISFGDISMMSAGTMMTNTGATHNNNNNNHPSHHDDNDINNNNSMMMKLEDIGTSFGTMMSLGTTMRADMVDGGLVDSTIGTSFGSLSLDPANNRESLFRAMDTTAAGGAEGIYPPEAAPPPNPIFDSERKAKGNLLECSDTESETSEDKQKLTQQKSQAWEKMKQATETKLKQQGSRGSVTSEDLMPPPNLLLVGVPPHLTPLSQQQMPPSSLESKMPATFENAEVAIPTTQLENNFSALSAWSAVDDFDGGVEEDVAAVAAAASYPPPPPPSQPLEKEDSW